MNEADLKRRLKKAIEATMRGAVVFRHEDTFTAGIPDLSVTWGGVTSWWEVKYARIGRVAHPTKLQAYTLDQLNRAGHAGLIVYKETKVAGKAVFLGFAQGDAVRFPGFAHNDVAQAIRDLHVIPPSKEHPQ